MLNVQLNCNYNTNEQFKRSQSPIGWCREGNKSFSNVDVLVELSMKPIPQYATKVIILMKSLKDKNIINNRLLNGNSKENVFWNPLKD